MRTRATADLARCQNNLRQLSLFAAQIPEPDPRDLGRRLTNEIPAGTIANATLTPEERLSWFVTALPWFDQRRTNAPELLGKLDMRKAWNASPNESAARMKLEVLLCPGLPPEIDPNQPAPTNYFGTSGLGLDSATLPVRKLDLKLGGFGKWSLWLVPPRAGCFRYDSPTPFEAISDGFSTTILLAEREPDTGPWIRGGPSTVRGVDTAPNAPAYIGPGSQFGGGHAFLANFAFADGSARPISQNVDPRLIDAWMTIAGGKREEEQIAE